MSPPIHSIIQIMTKSNSKTENLKLNIELYYALLYNLQNKIT